MSRIRLAESRVLPRGALSARLAARFHQRQTALLRRAQRLSDEVARGYRALAARIAQAAGQAGFAGLPRLRTILDALFAAVRADLEVALVDVARDGHRTALEAILSAIPAEWLPVFLGMAQAARHTESHAGPLAGGAPLREAAPSLDPLPWEASYELEPVARREVSRDEAMQLIRGLLFPAPTEEDVRRWLSTAVPGGLDWDQRLRRWVEPVRAAMLNELSIGLAAGENVDGLRARLEPFTGGLAYKAQRIARTEAGRVAERASREAIDGMGEFVQGMQIVAVMDEWTRPEHAARNGRVYTRGADGVYRDEAGNPLPDLPDAPNCRCTTIPVLRMPEAFRQDPALRATFETAAGRLIPDPASYADWWQQASERQRMLAVGVKRYQAVRDLLGAEPQWIDFLGEDGQLLSIAALRAESPAARQERQIFLAAVLDARKKMFQAVASRGYALGPRIA